MSTSDQDNGPGVRSSAPSQGSFAIVASDTDDGTADQYFRGLYVGVTGDVAVVNRDGTVTLFKNIAAGVAHPISGKRVNDTNTDATDMVGLV